MRDMSQEERRDLLKKLKTERISLQSRRFQQRSHEQLRNTRKAIARLLTVMKEVGEC